MKKSNEAKAAENVFYCRGERGEVTILPPNCYIIEIWPNQIYKLDGIEFKDLDEFFNILENKADNIEEPIRTLKKIAEEIKKSSTDDAIELINNKINSFEKIEPSEFFILNKKYVSNPAHGHEHSWHENKYENYPDPDNPDNENGINSADNKLKDIVNNYKKNILIELHKLNTDIILLKEGDKSDGGIRYIFNGIANKSDNEKIKEIIDVLIKGVEGYFVFDKDEFYNFYCNPKKPYINNKDLLDFTLDKGKPKYLLNYFLDQLIKKKLLPEFKELKNSSGKKVDEIKTMLRPKFRIDGKELPKSWINDWGEKNDNNKSAKKNIEGSIEVFKKSLEKSNNSMA
jgi:hypothetical protein